ncbi:hypothetical protein CLPUN_29550 [Clostridium puniceum]|uniref:Uncharacterized protein n=1 Tax=Clostridium puniceum TaxID=29367 RepID=A0A1S8TDU8_9CLOT|nr:hypothetical protein CLPUN_29550 [Clostridium puniceum]
MEHQTIYPTGETLYNPKKARSSYTIFRVMG